MRRSRRRRGRKLWVQIAFWSWKRTWWIALTISNLSIDYIISLLLIKLSLFALIFCGKEPVARYTSFKKSCSPDYQILGNSSLFDSTPYKPRFLLMLESWQFLTFRTCSGDFAAFQVHSTVFLFSLCTRLKHALTDCEPVKSSSLQLCRCCLQPCRTLHIYQQTEDWWWLVSIALKCHSTDAQLQLDSKVEFTAQSYQQDPWFD